MPGHGALISPCLCDGDMAMVHQGCLNSWRASGFKATNLTRCEVCRHRYEFECSSSRWTVFAHLFGLHAAELISFLVSAFAVSSVLLYTKAFGEFDSRHRWMWAVVVGSSVTAGFLNVVFLAKRFLCGLGSRATLRNQILQREELGGCDSPWVMMARQQRTSQHCDGPGWGEWATCCCPCDECCISLEVGELCDCNGTCFSGFGISDCDFSGGILRTIMALVALTLVLIIVAEAEDITVRNHVSIAPVSVVAGVGAFLLFLYPLRTFFEDVRNRLAHRYVVARCERVVREQMPALVFETAPEMSSFARSRSSLEASNNLRPQGLPVALPPIPRLLGRIASKPTCVLCGGKVATPSSSRSEGPCPQCGLGVAEDPF